MLAAVLVLLDAALVPRLSGGGIGLIAGVEEELEIEVDPSNGVV